MKLTILIGYAQTDAHGNPLGAAKVISGPPSTDAESREQAAIFTDAKQRHKFPKGIRHIAYGEFVPADRAAHVNDDLAEQIEAREALHADTIALENKKRSEEQAKRNAIRDASVHLSKAAVAHNNAMSALVEGKRRLTDAEANYKATKTESHKAELEAAKSKVAELAKAEESAKAELTAAKQAKADAIAGVVAAPQDTAAESETSSEETAEPEKKGILGRVGDLLTGK